MIHYPSLQSPYTKTFWLFVILYVLSYCFIPYFLSVTLWPDSAQMFTWSQYFAWGYHEHPWVPPFIMQVFTKSLHYSPLSIFIIGALLNVMAFWGVWRLGRKFLPEECALIAALVLSSYLLASFFLGQVNNNTFNYGFWPIMYLCFYNAIVTQKTRYWIAAGIIASLATLSKYYTLMPIACIGIFILLDKQARRSFGSQGIYWGILVAIVVLLPHIIWLFKHDFVSIRYALDRSESEGTLLYKISKPFVFSLSQMGNFLLPLLILAGIHYKYPSYVKSEWEISSFDKQFVFWVALGPFLLTVLLSVILGWNLPNEWGQALPCLWGLAIVTFALPKIPKKDLPSLIKVLYCSMFALMLMSILFLQMQSRIKPYIALNFPASKVAQYANEEWNKRFPSAFKYIISSDEYIGGVVSFYSTNHPDVYSDCVECINAVQKASLNKDGAMIVLTDGYGGHFHLNKVAVQIRKNFPNLIVLPTRYIQGKRAPNNKNVPQPIIWMAILPPINK